jgi:hypothetical protein
MKNSALFGDFFERVKDPLKISSRESEGKMSDI